MIKKILVVDDESAIREMLRDVFSETDFVVTEASSAEEAIEILKKESIFVIFVDIRLPGMSGLDLCRAIRHKYPIACIYAITGYASVYELADCRAAGFDDYLTKPLNVKSLLTLAETSFDKIERWSKQLK